MHIGSARVFTFKNYLQTETFPLTPGFNVIVGQNNAGKTALIEALSLRLGNVPHRSLATIPSRLAHPPYPSRVEAQISFEIEEILDIFAYQHPSAYVPIHEHEDQAQAAHRMNVSLDSYLCLNVDVEASRVQKAWFPSIGPYLHPQRTLQVSNEVSEAGATFTPLHITPVTGEHNFAHALAKIAQERIYVFKAERMNIGNSPFGHQSKLVPNAENLPEVLTVLQSTNRHRFDRFNNHVSTIFPHVTHISVVPRPNNRVEILVWTIPLETERDDLAVPLSQSGTGISQVLAILYIAMTAEYPQILLIDEPQSFLHPGAVRKLIEILKVHYPQHQYVLTTHSPQVISAAEPGTVLLVKRGPDQSHVQPISTLAEAEMNEVLGEVGARLSDVFGADDILWVEGPTEERCFPVVLEHVAKRPLLGTAVLAVEHTGDFESKRAKFAERSFALYRRLSEGTGLVPPALAFVFDREGRTAEQLEDLRRSGGGKVHFLPRRLYENYLLDVDAIWECVRGIEGFQETPLEVSEIRSWIDTHCWDAKYFDREFPEEDRSPEVWSRDIHGAKFLADLFASLSEQRVVYHKTTHSVILTRFLATHKPEALAELAALLVRILDTQNGAG